MEEQKKSNNKNKLFIIGGVVLLVIVLVGTIFLTKNIKQKRVEEAQRQEEIIKEEERKKAEEERARKKKEKAEEMAKFYLEDNMVLDFEVPEGFIVEKEESIISFKKNEYIFHFSITEIDETKKRDIKGDFENLFKKELKDNTLNAEIKELKTSIFDGYYFAPATNIESENETNNYKYFSQSVGYIEDKLFLATYFSKNNNEESFDQWVKIIESMEVKKVEDFNLLEHDSKKLGMRINSDSFEITSKSENKDYYLLGSDGDFIISAQMNKVGDSKIDSAKKCIDATVEKANKFPFELNNKNIYEKDRFYVFEYFINEIEGEKINQKNIWATTFKDGHCLSFHLSKVLYTEVDQKLFDEYLEKIEIIEN